MAISPNTSVTAPTRTRPFGAQLPPAGAGFFFADLESSLLRGERRTVKALAAQEGLPIAQIRARLCQHFGSRISFTKGRTGGIKLAST